MAKSIQGPVGRGGRNSPAAEVLTIQYLLNCVPAHRGGPQPELVMDGICGPKTIRAIETFQTRNVGFADGRVDPGGRTLQALQQFDPAPHQPLGMTGAGKGGHGKSPGKFGPGGKYGQDPFHPAGGKHGPGGKYGQDPFHPAGGKHGPGGKYGQDPFHPAGGKHGPGGKYGQDPFHPAGGKHGPGGKYGQDPFHKGGGKSGPGGKFG
jgi:hypothetical protein